jgi:ribosomal protein S18 acetylase RimI-like enzyme
MSCAATQTPTPVQLRQASKQDLPAIVGLLADDPLGARREKPDVPLPASYERAFEAIAADPNHRLVVAEAEDGRVVAVLQLTFTPHLTHQGGWRATIEGVRVSRPCRGTGIGRQLLDWAMAEAQARGCHVIQLTTDKQRPEAKRFYESLGFVASHEGMKRPLAA